MSGDDDEDSTLAPLRSRTDSGLRGLWTRRAMVGLMCLLVIAALSGWAGVHTSTATASGDGYSLRVTYAQVARAGLDVPLSIQVTAPGTIADDVVLAISSDYFRLFESQGFHPEPTSESSDADNLYLTFSAPPAGNTMTVDYDAYIEPSEQSGRDATITLIAAGVPRVAVTISTVLVP